MKRFVVLLLLAAVLLHAGELLRMEDGIDAMGTTFTVIAYDEDQQRLEQGVGAALAEAERLNQMLSNYSPGSEWSKVNRDAYAKPVPVSEELFSLLSKCLEFSRQSQGSFDITVGPLMKVWGFYRGSGRLPAKTEIAGAMASVGYQNIVLDGKTRSVRFRKPNLEIDPGGIGKGYAVDRMIEKLKENGIKSAMISAGASSIYALGAPPNDTGWTVEIRNPRQWTEAVAEVQLRDQSLSTSGDYEKFFEVEGKVYSHIMDPRTGYPAVGMLSVSVIAPLSLTSEAWSKPFFILGRDWSVKNKPKGLRVFLCEDKTPTECAWLQ